MFGGRWVYLGRFLWHQRRLPRLREPVRITDKLAARILSGESAGWQREFSDKLRCREIVAEICPELRQKRVMAIIESASDFTLEALPQTFVLKPNHASGMNAFVHDKRWADERLLRDLVNWWLELDYYEISYEPCYRGIVPKVFAEEMVLNARGYPPSEIQLFCVHGRVAFIECLMVREEIDGPLCDREWNRLPVWYPLEECEPDAPRPDALDEAIAIAEKIAAGTDFLRVDLIHLEDGTLVFNETACTPWGGLFRLKPRLGDELLGKMWEPYSVVPAPMDARVRIESQAVFVTR
ncbi:ATP-grasp fold amidoligase family protein [Acidicapsa dinghuensis]|uniref:ATP-grasp fold amidoligase family protein n=1 Tax=Acidicapsa dinghuensis TaxID=2218256 RepID=A0ABW1EK72_9BACT|nr:ATP-grasp fold amidoligase family protein [Acidicapsa dinghuensis]